MTDHSLPYVLGLSAYFHDAAAALTQGGRVIAAAQEERFTRRKADWRFPKQAIAYCLSELPAGTSLDAVAFYEDPTLKSDRILKNAVTQAPRGAAIWPKTLQTLRTLNHTLPHEILQLIDDPKRIFFTSHHRSHAASCFYPSPFEEAAILVVDGVGEWATTSIWHGKAGTLTALEEIQFPHSLGMLYSAFTQYCGFKVNTGEYKLMGLAPFGKPVFKKLIYQHLLELDEAENFRLNMDYFSYETDNSTINPLFLSLFRYPQRRPEEPISTHYMNVAASIQTVLNEVMLKLSNKALAMTGSENLCLAGGVALNCVTNTEIARHAKGLKNIWIQPAAGDAGGALGAALNIGLSLQSKSESDTQATAVPMDNAYLGPAYSPDEIIKTIEKHNLKYEDFRDNESSFEDAVSRALQEGLIIGYFDGRMEFGPRSLGNRSILADPRPKNMLQRANQKIKFRETWRPLAPIILEEFEGDYFETPVTDPYMLFVAELKEPYRQSPSLATMRAQGLSELPQFLNRVNSDFPAITHYDYSARTQALSKKDNPRLHRILSHFHQATGCPMLLNTSFNVRGEPIVCSPEDALNTFLNTHLDMLGIGPFLIRRSAQDEAIQKQIGRKKFRED